VNKKRKKPSAFAKIKSGLEDGIAQLQGKLTLRTTTLPMPPPVKSARRKELPRV